jgi:hypothetical protein
MKSLNNMSMEELENLRDKIQTKINIIHAANEENLTWKDEPIVKKLLEEYLRICKNRKIKIDTTIPIKGECYIEMDDFPDSIICEFSGFNDISKIYELINNDYEHDVIDNTIIKKIMPETYNEIKNMRNATHVLDKKIIEAAKMLKIDEYKLFEYFADEFFDT